MDERRTFKILCLDGGGAKGVYTLGFLRELQNELGSPLHEFFEAIYGTSTGAIIAALLGLGKSPQEILDLYLKHVPAILKPRWSYARSAALKQAADELFEDKTFESFKTFVGIVATNANDRKSLVFKSSRDAAFALKTSFVPGFGLRISDAVQASCSASPFFRSKALDLGVAGKVKAFDGGFSANNPSLFALTDALKSFKVNGADIRLLNVGVGHYPEPERGYLSRLLRSLPTAQLLQMTLDANANTTEFMMLHLFNDIKHLRVSDAFVEPEMATDLLECNITKLGRLVTKGRDSYASHGGKVKNLLLL